MLDITKPEVQNTLDFWFIQGSVYIGFWFTQGSVYTGF